MFVCFEFLIARAWGFFKPSLVGSLSPKTEHGLDCKRVRVKVGIWW